MPTPIHSRFEVFKLLDRYFVIDNETPAFSHGGRTLIETSRKTHLIILIARKSIGADKTGLIALCRV